jgi:hypothetical protein
MRGRKSPVKHARSALCANNEQFGSNQIISCLPNDTRANEVEMGRDTLRWRCLILVTLASGSPRNSSSLE